jgi:hypothetical protein
MKVYSPAKAVSEKGEAIVKPEGRIKTPSNPMGPPFTGGPILFVSFIVSFS